MLKSVKIMEKNYKWLVKIAGELQRQRGRPVSIDDAISWLQNKGNITELAGSWKMSDKEYAELIQKIKSEWRKWRPEFA